MTTLDPSLYARQLLELGVPRRSVLFLVLADIEATLTEWTQGLLSLDELELVRQARVHVQNAAHCIELTLTPADALCSEAQGFYRCGVCGLTWRTAESAQRIRCPHCGAELGWRGDTIRAPPSMEKVAPASAPTDPGPVEPTTARKPYSPPRLTQLSPDDPRVAKALATVENGIAECDRILGPR